MLVEDWQLLEGLLGTKYPTTQVLNFLGHFNFAFCMKWACIQVNVDVLTLALLNLLTLPTLTLNRNLNIDKNSTGNALSKVKISIIIIYYHRQVI